MVKKREGEKQNDTTRLSKTSTHGNAKRRSRSDEGGKEEWTELHISWNLDKYPRE